MQSLGRTQLQRLKPGFQPPLLTAPDGVAAAPAPAAAARGDAVAVPPTDQRRSLGAVHVCEHAECKLPAERWWEGNGGGGKGGRALRRTASAP